LWHLIVVKITRKIHPIRDTRSRLLAGCLRGLETRKQQACVLACAKA
jgi:hypothetical protein